mmetsp:Transcript_97190/g.216844  ORF Transcript_97190/g.216844 Transcript_97190/m.216844 type:complete len:264 (-) Transcript_97190:17-808(-)
MPLHRRWRWGHGLCLGRRLDSRLWPCTVAEKTGIAMRVSSHAIGYNCPRRGRSHGSLWRYHHLGPRRWRLRRPRSPPMRWSCLRGLCVVVPQPRRLVLSRRGVGPCERGGPRSRPQDPGQAHPALGTRAWPPATEPEGTSTLCWAVAPKFPRGGASSWGGRAMLLGQAPSALSQRLRVRRKSASAPATFSLVARGGQAAPHQPPQLPRHPTGQRRLRSKPPPMTPRPGGAWPWRTPARPSGPATTAELEVSLRSGEGCSSKTI